MTIGGFKNPEYTPPKLPGVSGNESPTSITTGAESPSKTTKEKTSSLFSRFVKPNTAESPKPIKNQISTDNPTLKQPLLEHDHLNPNKNR